MRKSVSRRQGNRGRLKERETKVYMKNNRDAMDKPRLIRILREIPLVRQFPQHSAKIEKFESFPQLEGEEMTAAP